MAILVVCRNCMSRFSVSEQFAGRKGPCPKCKELIEIPKTDEQVKVHTPEHSEGAVRGKSGQLVLKPVAREKSDVPMMVWIIVGVAALSMLMAALALRFMGTIPAPIIWIGALALAPPVGVGAYFFLRDEELGGYTGKEVWIRASIAGVVHALCWLGFSYLLPFAAGAPYMWMVIVPPLLLIGGTASFAALDLDFFSGVLHFVAYVIATAILALVMGLPLLGSDAPPVRDPRLGHAGDCLPERSPAGSLSRVHFARCLAPSQLPGDGVPEYAHYPTAGSPAPSLLRRSAIQRGGTAGDVVNRRRLASSWL